MLCPLASPASKCVCPLSQARVLEDHCGLGQCVNSHPGAAGEQGAPQTWAAHVCRPPLGHAQHVCAATRVASHQPRLHGICPPLCMLRRRWCESWMASRSASSGASGRSAPSGGWRACRATPLCAASGAFRGCCCASADGRALECWDSAAFAYVAPEQGAATPVWLSGLSFPTSTLQRGGAVLRPAAFALSLSVPAAVTAHQPTLPSAHFP